MQASCKCNGHASTQNTRPPLFLPRRKRRTLGTAHKPFWCIEALGGTLRTAAQEGRSGGRLGTLLAPRTVCITPRRPVVSGRKVEAQVAEPAASVANVAFRGKGLGTPTQTTAVKFRGGGGRGSWPPSARLPTACRRADSQRCRQHGSQCPLRPVCACGRCACTSQGSRLFAPLP